MVMPMGVAFSSDHDSVFVDLIPFWTILFVVVWAIWNVRRDSRDEKLVDQSLSWTEAQGVVVSSKVAWAHVEVTYEYFVGTARYTGSYQLNLPPGPPDRFGRTAEAMMSEAQQDIAEFPVGLDVIVRFNPSKPDQSVFYCRGKVGSNEVEQKSARPPEFVTLD